MATTTAYQKKIPLIFIIFILAIASCKKEEIIETPEEIITDTTEITDTTDAGGILSILDIDDSNIPDEIKDMIYEPNSGTFIIDETHPLYNHEGKIVVLPFELTDYPWNTAATPAVIEESYFGEGTGSFSDYFYENSYGKFKMTNGGISDVVSVPYSLTEWWASGVNEPTYQYVMNHASIDWPSLDTDGNKIITRDEVMIVLIYPFGGSGAIRYYAIDIETTDGTYTVSNAFVLIDIKRLDDPNYDVDPILYNPSATHELSHGFFSLPDRYGVTGYCGNGETGPYDPMAGGCVVLHLSAFDKMKIGWLKPKILEIPAHRISGQLDTLAFPASENNEAALVLWTEDAPDEFFVIENRHLASSALGFDNGLPDEGIGVWWSYTTGYSLHFVHALNTETLPQNQNYDTSEWDDDGFFKALPGDTTGVEIPLLNSDGVSRYSIRVQSQPDSCMIVIL